MNRLQKKIITIALALGNIVLSCVVAATATYAWFKASNATITTQSASTTIKSEAGGSTLQWEILKFDDNEKKGISYRENDEFFLQPYDQYLTAKNKHTNVILWADVMVSNFTSANQLYVDIECSPDHDPVYSSTATPEEKVPSYTSNICQFKSTVYSYTDADDNEVVVNDVLDNTNAATRYETTTNFFAGIKTPGTRFVALHNSTPNKDHSITLCPNFDIGASTAKKITIAVECSYNEKLVAHYANGRLGTINLAGDITSFNFRTGASYSGAYVKVTNQSQLDTSGRYMITYDGTEYAGDDMKAAFNGSGTSSEDFTGKLNYRDVFARKGRITETEVTHAQSWDYNIADSKLTSNSGYVVGATGSGMGASKSGSYTNTLTYNSGLVDTGSNSKYLNHNATAGGTKYNYYDSASGTKRKSPEFYRYDASAFGDMILSGIQLGGSINHQLEKGQPFSYGGTVTAVYNEGTASEFTENIPVNDPNLSFTGYDMNNDGNYLVTVSYTDVEDNITVTANYNLEVYTPEATLVSLSIAGQQTQFVEGDTFTLGDNAVITAHYSDGTNPVIQNNDSRLTINGPTQQQMDTEGTYEVNISFNDGTTTKSIEPYDIEVVAQTAAVYQRITSTSDLTNGTYLFVHENNSVALNGGLSTIDVVSNTISVSISNYQIEATAEVDAAAFTYNSTTKYFMNANNKYLSNSSDIDLVDTGVAHNVSFDSDNAIIKIGTESSSPRLRFNNNDGQKRFRYYTNDNMDAIQLYKKVNVSPLTSITLSNTTNTYYTGDTFVNPTITAHYKNGTQNNIDPSQCSIVDQATGSSPDLTTAGVKTIEVSYTENGVTKSDTYDITVTQTLPISLTNLSGYKTQFYTGDTFVIDSSGNSFSALVTYNSPATKTVHSSDVSHSTPDMSTAGQKTITISYTENGTTVSATYNITVTQKAISSIAVTTMPSKTTYTQGESLSTSGITVTATYNNGSQENVTSGCTYSPTTLNTVGTQAITVTHTASGKTTTFNVTVKAPVVLTGIECSGYTEEYTVGDTYQFDATVTASYSDGSSHTVTPTSVNPSTIDTSTDGDHTITVSYTEGSVTKTDSYTVSVVAGSSTTSVTFDFKNNSYSLATSQSGSKTAETGAANMTINNYAYNTSNKEVRLYKSNSNYGGTSKMVFTIDESKVIKSIVITGAGAANLSLGAGGGSYSNGTWTGSSTSVTIQNNTSSTQAIYTITITYESGSTPTPASISVSPTTLSMTVGGSDQTITATTSGGSGGSIEWSSTNTSVATVAGGTVHAVAAGSATIKANYEGAEATCEVTVTGSSSGTTVSISSFSSISGNIGSGSIVSYSAYKGGGTSGPAVNDGAIRLYQNSSGSTGGYVVIGVSSGHKIKSVTIKSTMGTTTGYYLGNPGSTTPSKSSFEVSNYSLSANAEYTVSDLDTQYITFACFGTSSSTRLYLSYISVTYL